MWIQGQNRENANILKEIPTGWRNSRLPRQKITLSYLDNEVEVNYIRYCYHVQDLLLYIHENILLSEHIRFLLVLSLIHPQYFDLRAQCNSSGTIHVPLLAAVGCTDANELPIALHKAYLAWAFTCIAPQRQLEPR